MDSLVILKKPQLLQLSVQKYLMFNVFGEGRLHLLKRYYFLTISRLYLIKFLCEIYMEKVLQELFCVFFWVLIPFKRYQNTSGWCTARTLFYPVSIMPWIFIEDPGNLKHLTNVKANNNSMSSHLVSCCGNT